MLTRLDKAAAQELRDNKYIVFWTSPRAQEIFEWLEDNNFNLARVRFNGAESGGFEIWLG